jgi:SMI1 / KNR4 family (SUKH-1)
MTKRDWQALLKRLEVNTRMGELAPVTAEAIETFEEKRGVKLPRSYRAFCEDFGAGEFGERFKIAAPGYQGDGTGPSFYSLEHLDKAAHEGLEYEVYSPDPEQHKRGVFFCHDTVRSFHFFDPEEVTDRRRREYAVYTLFVDFKVRRTADDFGQFVTDFCLSKKIHQLVKGRPALQLFLPVGNLAPPAKVRGRGAKAKGRVNQPSRTKRST